MKYILIFLTLINCNCFYAQEIVVKDKLTKEPVPYINIFVEGENVGTTANEKGIFNVPKAKQGQVLVLSATGYETLKLRVKDLTDVVLLTPAITELQEVIITTKKEHAEFKIGSFKKKDIKGYLGCGNVPWMTGRFFPYDTLYNRTPYLKEIKLNTMSNIKDAKMNIRLYLPDENGKPGSFLHNENIIFTVKKGTNYPVIDLSALNIQFPETGFFIVAEWLIIGDNKYEYDYTMEGSKTLHKGGVLYQPSLAALQSQSAENNIIYVNGIWGNVFERPEGKNENTVYNIPAMELTLSN